MLLFSGMPAKASAADGSRIVVEQTQPTLALIPQEGEVALRISTLDKLARPQPTLLTLSLLAPPTSPWASTDFPWVEGSTLSAYEIALVGGVHELQFVPPIRGRYTLNISAHPMGGGAPLATLQYQLEIGENPTKMRHLGLMLSSIFALTVGIGTLLGRAYSSRLLAGQSGVLSTFLLLVPAAVMFASQGARAHGPGHERATSSVEAAGALPDGSSFQLVIHSSTLNPKVGELQTLRGQVLHADGRTEPARYHLQLRQLEHDQVVFATVLPGGSQGFVWQGSYSDGSAHQVVVEAHSLGADSRLLARATLGVDVEALAPPWQATSKAMAVFLGVATFGLALGVLLGQRRALPAH